MTAHRRLTPLFALAALVATALPALQCSGSSSPTSPSTSSVMRGVTLSASTTSVGTTVQGVVSMTGASPAGGVSISLASSDPAVATVPTPLQVPDGASSATFAITTTATGVTMITASLNGARESSMLTVTAGATLASIALSADSVIGGNAVTGTVRLSEAAGPGGALVVLSSADPVAVPPAVLVPQGALSATFDVSTRAVGGAIAVTVGGSYAGVSKSATLSVQPAASPSAAIASFGVSGTSGSDTCVLVNGGNSLDCTFNGSSSTAPGTIVAWNWSYSVATTIVQTTSGPVLTMPVANCGLLPPPPGPAGTTQFPFTVRLTVRDSLGNVSAEVVNTGARVIAQGVCGF